MGRTRPPSTPAHSRTQSMSTPPTPAGRFALIRERRLPCIIVLVAMSCPGTLLADRVELKTGEVFFGKILRADRREVSMRLQSGGILSFRRNQVALFRKNYVTSDEWIPSPVLPVDDPAFDPQAADPVDTSSGGSPTPVETGSSPTPADTEEPDDGISLGSAAELDPALVRPPVEDSRLRVSPPRCFLDWEPPNGSTLRRFYDPVTQADLDIVDLGTTVETIETIKTKTSRAHARETGTGLRVLQDERVRDVAYEGWYFEFQEEIGETAIRRVWLFARGARSALLLRYSCPEEHYGEFRRPFGESIRSFSFTEEAGETAPPAVTSPEKPAEKPPPRNVDPAEELLRLLRSNQDRKKSKKAVDEFLNQKPGGNR